MKALACLLAAAAWIPASAAEKITAESVIDGYVKAMGGAKALARIQSETVIGNVADDATGKTGSYSLLLKSPDRYKGSNLVFEQTKVNDEVWLPSYTEIHVGLRVLWSRGRGNVVQRFSDYRKFTAESKIVTVNQ